MQTWEHSKLVDNRLVYLGAGLLENRADRHLTERGSWESIEAEGWELIAVVPNSEAAGLIHYFKRPAQKR